MLTTLAFDVYGTLIDTSGVVETLKPMVGERAKPLSDLWRAKQLEYSFRRGLMQDYEDFAVCTRQALDFAAEAIGAELHAQQKNQLMDAYRALPAYREVREGLTKAQGLGARLFAFSNGRKQAVAELLGHAGIAEFFEGIVSVHRVRSFKPNPTVYAHFLRATGAHASKTWLVSSNPFDVIGALSTGWRAAWVRRSPEAIFDPWGVEPTAVIGSLTELPTTLAGK